MSTTTQYPVVTSDGKFGVVPIDEDFYELWKIEPDGDFKVCTVAADIPPENAVVIAADIAAKEAATGPSAEYLAAAEYAKTFGVS